MDCTFQYSVGGAARGVKRAGSVDRGRMRLTRGPARLVPTAPALQEALRCGRWRERGRHHRLKRAAQRFHITAHVGKENAALISRQETGR
jgi:hypothetical protein